MQGKYPVSGEVAKWLRVRSEMPPLVAKWRSGQKEWLRDLVEKYFGHLATLSLGH